MFHTIFSSGKKSKRMLFPPPFSFKCSTCLLYSHFSFMEKLRIPGIQKWLHPAFFSPLLDPLFFFVVQTMMMKHGICWSIVVKQLLHTTISTTTTTTTASSINKTCTALIVHLQCAKWQSKRLYYHFWSWENSPKAATAATHIAFLRFSTFFAKKNLEKKHAKMFVCEVILLFIHNTNLPSRPFMMGVDFIILHFWLKNALYEAKLSIPFHQSHLSTLQEQLFKIKLRLTIKIDDMAKAGILSIIIKKPKKMAHFICKCIPKVQCLKSLSTP